MLNQIPNSGKWSDISTTLNDNFGVIATKLLRYEDLTTATKGFFATSDELLSAWPNASRGSRAFVGSAAPYAIWLYGESGWVDSGDVSDGSVVFDWHSIPDATTSAAGLMSAGDKTALDAAKSDIESLQTGKADTSALNEAKTSITDLQSGKADKTALDAAISAITDKADKSELNAAKTNITENSNKISALSGLLDATAKKADTATRLLTFDGECRNPTIEMVSVSSYDAILFDTARCIFLAMKSLKYYNVFPESSHYNAEKDGTLLARTDRLFLHTNTQLVYTFNGSSLNPFILSSAQKDKLAAYPSQFVLDLGNMPTQAKGEARAAASEVAGNRNISFIRFQVQGVSTLKTTLIMQWPNGINETAQIMFVDKAQWRRNVTGATGVKGDPTNAFKWERTAPHFIAYDKSRRMIQLKDYQQIVSREVELPLATSTQHGLMNSSDKAKMDAYPRTPQGISTATEEVPGLMSVADKEKLDNYPSTPLAIPLATLTKPGLMAATDCRTLADTTTLATQNKNDIETLQSTAEQQEQRISTLESFHAPSDMVEMTIQNDKAQRNVLFFKIEWIDDLEIDGRPINTEGLSGKFYRSLSVGEHKVRFRVSQENRKQRGLLGWADDEAAGYLSHVTRIVIPEGWTELPANCFERRLHLEEIVLPSTLEIVGGNCFQSLPALRELIIPEGVTTINWSAINDCASLKSIRMGGNESMPLSLASDGIRNCPALTCIEFLPCQLTFKGSASPFQNLPQLNALICHLTAAPTFEPSTPFGTIGSGTTERKTLYRPAGVAFYDEGAWLNNLRNGLGFYVADL